MKLFLVQMQPEANDKQTNLRKIIDYIDAGLTARANLIVFGECALIGYRPSSKVHFSDLAEPIPGPTTEVVAEKLAGSNCLVLFGMVENDQGDIYNSAPLIGPNGVIGVGRKLHLVNFEPLTAVIGFDESWYFKPGQRITILDTMFGRIGIQICLDIAHPEIALAQALAGCWLILQPMAAPITTIQPVGMISTQTIKSVRAADCMICLASVNLAGDHSAGGSCVFLGPQGVVAMASSGEETKEEILEYEIDPEEVYTYRTQYPILKGVRPELMQDLWEITQKTRHSR